MRYITPNINGNNNIVDTYISKNYISVMVSPYTSYETASCDVIIDQFMDNYLDKHLKEDFFETFHLN